MGIIKLCNDCNTNPRYSNTAYCSLCRTERNRRWRKNNGNKARSSWLLNKYNMTVKEYEKLLEEQNYVCAICKQDDIYRLCVDHDHKFNYNRGLLCGKCNKALGLFKDNPELLKAAANYIEKWYV